MDVSSAYTRQKPFLLAVLHKMSLKKINILFYKIFLRDLSI